MQKLKEVALCFLSVCHFIFFQFYFFKRKRLKVLLTFTAELCGCAAFFFCISVRWFVLTVTALYHTTEILQK